MYLFKEQTYLLHATNLTSIFQPYVNIVTSKYQPTQEEKIWLSKIKNLADQLQEHTRHTRSINFLGTAFKYVFGNPDHYDLVNIETSINNLIENNNKQKTINSRFEQILQQFEGQSLKEHLVIEQVYEQLLLLTRTINAAKNNEYLSESLDLDDIKNIIQHEIIQVPIINILEYSKIFLARTDEFFITIYKYPVLIKSCKLYKVTPLNSKHGKIITDKTIALCNQTYLRTRNCQNHLSKNICEINFEEENCLIPLLKNITSKCNIKQEYDYDLEIESGVMLLSGKHKLNNQTINGINLVTYENTINLDDKIYKNMHKQIKEVILRNHNSESYIDQIIKEDTMYKFDNIDTLKKLIIPFEEKPILSTIYTIVTLIVILAFTYVMIKTIQCITDRQKQKKIDAYNKTYEREMLKIASKNRDDFV